MELRSIKTGRNGKTATLATELQEYKHLDPGTGVVTLWVKNSEEKKTFMIRFSPDELMNIVLSRPVMVLNDRHFDGDSAAMWAWVHKLKDILRDVGKKEVEE